MTRNELKIERIYVNLEALVQGERIEKAESEFTEEELKEIRCKQTDKLMESFGYIRADAM
jgi:hypothetical protein